MATPQWAEYREAESNEWANSQRPIRVRGGLRGGASKTLTAAQSRRVREATAKVRRNKAISRF